MPNTTRRRSAPSRRHSAATPARPAEAEPPSRRLTLGYFHYEQHREGHWAGSRRVPVLRLGGLWLQQAGFEIGQRVQVRVCAGRLVIEPVG